LCRTTVPALIRHTRESCALELVRMINLGGKGAPHAIGRQLPSLAVLSTWQPQHVRRQRLLSESEQLHQAGGRLLIACATGFGTAQPAGEHDVGCVFLL
jgi:hypothetical protein